MTCEDEVIFDSPQWKNYSRACIDLITKLLAKKPEERITLDQVFAHPWLRNFASSPETPKNSGQSNSRNIKVNTNSSYASQAQKG